MTQLIKKNNPFFSKHYLDWPPSMRESTKHPLPGVLETSIEGCVPNIGLLCHNKKKIVFFFKTKFDWPRPPLLLIMVELAGKGQWLWLFTAGCSHFFSPSTALHLQTSTKTLPQKVILIFFCYCCYNPHLSRDSVSPVCGTFYWYQSLWQTDVLRFRWFKRAQ